MQSMYLAGKILSIHTGVYTNTNAKLCKRPLASAADSTAVASVLVFNTPNPGRLGQNLVNAVHKKDNNL